MSFSHYDNNTARVECFEDTLHYFEEDDMLGKWTMKGLKEQVLVAVEHGWQSGTNSTLVAASTVKASDDEIKELWDFLDGLSGVKLVFHDTENQRTILDLETGRRVTCFFLFRGESATTQLSVYDQFKIQSNGFDLKIGSAKKPAQMDDRRSSEEGLFFGEELDVTGQGMTQSTEYHFTPKKTTATKKPAKKDVKKAAPGMKTRSRK